MNKFIFCFYDLNYTPEFVKSWVALCNFLLVNKVKFLTTQSNSCNAFYAKQMCLGGSVLSGPKQTPFQGRVKYEYLVFLSGKTAFSVKDFVALYTKSNKLGLPFMSANVEGRNKLVGDFINNIALAEHAEFDMVIVRNGVFEKLSYPWFKPHVSKNIKQMDFVDVDICKRFREEAMIDLYVNDQVNLKRGTVIYE